MWSNLVRLALQRTDLQAILPAAAFSLCAFAASKGLTVSGYTHMLARYKSMSSKCVLQQRLA